MTFTRLQKFPSIPRFLRVFIMTYIQNGDRLIDTENKLMVTKRESGWGDKSGVQGWQKQATVYKTNHRTSLVVRG